MTAERDEWLDWRRQGIGASDVAAIIGISPWASPWSVWADKSGLLPPEPENEYMTAGRFLEAAIGPWFTHETGLYVAGEQTWCTHVDHGHHRCTVDGFVFESPFSNTFAKDIGLSKGVDVDATLGVLEIKTAGFGKRWDPIPEHYQAQGQWQMHVTGMDRVWFAVLMGRRLDIHELERDQADIDFMVERVNAFWADHVLAGEPPPTDGHDATTRALAAVYPTEVPGETVEVHPDNLDEWRGAADYKRTAEREEKEAANVIRAVLGDAEVGTVDGQTVVTLRAQTRRTTCPNCNHVTESDPFRVLRAVKPKEK